MHSKPAAKLLTPPTIQCTLRGNDNDNDIEKKYYTYVMYVYDIVYYLQDIWRLRVQLHRYDHAKFTEAIRPAQSGCTFRLVFFKH